MLPAPLIPQAGYSEYGAYDLYRGELPIETMSFVMVVGMALRSSTPRCSTLVKGPLSNLLGLSGRISNRSIGLEPSHRP